MRYFYRLDTKTNLMFYILSDKSYNYNSSAQSLVFFCFLFFYKTCVIFIHIYSIKRDIFNTHTLAAGILYIIRKCIWACCCSVNVTVHHTKARPMLLCDTQKIKRVHVFWPEPVFGGGSISHASLHKYTCEILGREVSPLSPQIQWHLREKRGAL